MSSLYTAQEHNLSHKTVQKYPEAYGQGVVTTLEELGKVHQKRIQDTTSRPQYTSETRFTVPTQTSLMTRQDALRRGR